MESKELAVMQEESTQSMTVAGVHRQIQLIQEIMQNEMKDGEHYGTVPGCGDKKVLLKPGAEKLSLLFKMAPRFKIENVDMGNGHREVRIVTELYHIESGKFLGEGVGSCSTMETKYRYRGNEVEPTGEVVPKEYWKTRNPDLLGGKGFVAKKIDGQWLICVKGERMENPDIADTYNTVLKMGKKRSQVDAVLTVTAASDLFTQDLEENAPEAQAAPKAAPAMAEPRKAVSSFEPSPEEQAAVVEDHEIPFGDAPEEVKAPQNVSRGTIPAQTEQSKPLPKDRRRIQAKFASGPCSCCGEQILKGQWIWKNAKGMFVHEVGPKGSPCL